MKQALYRAIDLPLKRKHADEECDEYLTLLPQGRKLMDVITDQIRDNVSSDVSPEFAQRVFADFTMPDNVESLIVYGICCVPISDERLLVLKHALSTFNMSRRQEFDKTVIHQYNKAKEVFQLVQEHLLTEPVIEKMKTYFTHFRESEDPFSVYCYSNVTITPTNVERVQKLHTDHKSPPGSELVFAVDLSGSNLNTQYFTGSHKLFNEYVNVKETARIPNIRDAKEKCSINRALELLKYCDENDKEIHYVNANCPAILFDACGLHAGNAVSSNGPRLFMTFRTKEFHDSGAGSTSTDTWFVPKEMDSASPEFLEPFKLFDVN